METQELARRIRVHSLKMTHRAKSSHIGGCLSCADILAVLYNDVLKVDPARPDWEERDRFVMSKGHAAAALYAVLAEKGFFPVEELETFCQDGSRLMGHVNHHVPGVEVSTGSLGHGLSIGCGMALADRSRNVYVLLSDGDLNEGSTWEAAMFAGHHNLVNLTAIVDYNGLQALGGTESVLALDRDPLGHKWEAFGWKAGHISDLPWVPRQEDFPICFIADTTKGKGVSFMEGEVWWHYGHPNDVELEVALKELGV